MHNLKWSFSKKNAISYPWERRVSLELREYKNEMKNVESTDNRHVSAKNKSLVKFACPIEIWTITRQFALREEFFDVMMWQEKTQRTVGMRRGQRPTRGMPSKVRVTNLDQTMLGTSFENNGNFETFCKIGPGFLPEWDNEKTLVQTKDFGRIFGFYGRKYNENLIKSWNLVMWLYCGVIWEF